LNHFWPSRPNPEGFSIDKLAKGYRDKISKFTHENVNENLKQDYPKKNNLKSRLIDNKVYNSNTINIHWANRSFEEYRDAA
tara:strand:+ start:553 stop:795 length:243 start_codon:yes stop_codon:yes gene_type:complete